MDVNFPVGGDDLELIRERCKGLTTLEMYVQRGNSGGLVKKERKQVGGEHAEERLREIHGVLSQIGSLSVVVRLYDGSLKEEVEELMIEFGWEICR